MPKSQKQHKIVWGMISHSSQFGQCWIGSTTIFIFFLCLSVAYNKDWKRKLVRCLKEYFWVLEVNHPRSTIGFETTKASTNFEWDTWENKLALKTNLKTLIALLNFYDRTIECWIFSVAIPCIWAFFRGVLGVSKRPPRTLFVCNSLV